MKLVSLMACVLLACSALAADDVPAWWPKGAESVVVRVLFDDVESLRKFSSETAPWMVVPAKLYVVLDVDRAAYADYLARGLRVEHDRARTRELITPRAIDVNQRSGIPGFECYRTVDETLATGAQIATNFPQLATWTDIGDSWEKENGFGGEDLMVLKLTNSAIGGDKPKLFVMSAIHAREYTTAELNTRFAEYLVNGYGNDADATWLLDYNEVHLLLVTNVDGREQAQTGLSWRKNANQNYCGATSNNRGADLNRNYDFGWGCCNGSSGSQCNATYRGAGPSSEPETDAVQDYVRSIYVDARGPNDTDAAPDTTTGIFLDVHSFSELVLWPWGFTATVAPNGADLQTLGRRFAWFNGYEPTQAIGLYPTDGTTDDFAYGELGLPAYTFELGTSFFQDCGTFESTILPDNLQALIYAAKAVRAPYQTPSGPSAVDVGLDNAAVAQGNVVALTATLDDTGFNNSNGTEPTQSIIAAEYSIDSPPWEAGVTPIAMTAADGSFNTTAEAASATIDTTALGQGRHTIFVRGQDTSGAWGPMSAAFLYVIDPVSAPRINGRVLAADTGQPLEATVSAGNFSTSSDPATGNYELVLIAGNYSISVEPLDSSYGSLTLPAVSVQDFDVVPQNALLYPFCDVFSDDMETAGGAWSTTGAWSRTQQQSNSPTYSYTDSPSGSYPNNANTSLTSPALDLNGIDAVTVDFASRCDTEFGYDYCVVEISSDGVNFSEIGRYDGPSSNFVARSIDVSDFAGTSAARLRFRLTTDVSITDDGWYVDDVSIRGAGAQCVTLTDSDNDGVSDFLDNCTLAANSSQIDTNGDGYGNACDPDVNNDGVVNALDLGLFKQSFFATGLGDTDFNADGVTNPVDLGILKGYFFGPPGPSANVN